MRPTTASLYPIGNLTGMRTPKQRRLLEYCPACGAYAQNRGSRSCAAIGGWNPIPSMGSSNQESSERLRARAIAAERFLTSNLA